MNFVRDFLERKYSNVPLRADALSPSFFLATPRFKASSHVVSFIFAEGTQEPLWVVKVPRFAGDDDSLKSEAANLRRLHSSRPGGFASIPQVVSLEQVDDYLVFVQTAMKGQPMGPALVRRQSRRCIEAVLAWIIDLHQSSAIRDPAASRHLRLALENDLDQLGRILPLNRSEEVLVARTREIAGSLEDFPLPSVFEHGDLSYPNILLTRSGTAEILDWELAEPKGLPMGDLIFFLTYIAFAQNNSSDNGNHQAAFEQAFFAEKSWTRPYVLRYAQAVSLPPNSLAPLFVLGWARYVSKLAHRIVGTERLSTESATWLRGHRYYSFWRHSIEHFSELCFASGACSSSTSSSKGAGDLLCLR